MIVAITVGFVITVILTLYARYLFNKDNDTAVPAIRGMIISAVAVMFALDTIVLLLLYAVGVGR